VALATPGVLGLGLGATVMAFRDAKQDDPEPLAPILIMSAGAAATVAGIIVWAVGAGHDEGEVALSVQPTGANLNGRF
jgi:hypothetical protein